MNQILLKVIIDFSILLLKVHSPQPFPYLVKYLKYAFFTMYVFFIKI